MLWKFVIIFIACPATVVYGSSESPYNKILDCDWDRPCWSFVDEYMLELLNKFKDSEFSPCNDFSLYALGSYFSPGRDENLFDFVEMLYDDKLEEFIKKPLSYDRQKSTVLKLLSKMAAYYQKCMGDTTVTTPPVLEYLPSMPSIRWPNWTEALTESEWQTSFSPWNYVGEFRRYGLNRLFIDERVTTAYNDSTKYVVELKIPAQVVDDVLQRYYEVQLLNHNITKRIEDRQMSLLSRIDEFEKLAKNLRSMYRIRNRRKPYKKLLTLGELKVKVPTIDWQGYFNASIQQRNVNDELLVQVDSLYYLRDIGTLIDQTDDKTVAFYILLRFLLHSSEVMPHEYFGECKEQLSMRFSLGAQYIYDRFIYENRQQDEEELQKIFSALKERLLKNISYNKFNLSRDAHDSLQRKLNRMTIKIGNLPTNKSIGFYNRFYDNYETTPSAYWTYQWDLIRFNFDQEHSKLFKNGGRVDPEGYFESNDPFKQRAMPYFEKHQNRIIIPFEFMRPPFFTHGLDPVYRQSLTAFSIAREMMTALLDEILFEIAENEALKCLLDNRDGDGDGNGDSDPDEDKDLYLAERFADVGGLQLVVETYFNQLKPESRGPFFLHVAQYFAGHVRNSLRYGGDLKMQDFDSRLNFMVSNVPEFARVFECAVGTNGNPEKKCQI